MHASASSSLRRYPQPEQFVGREHERARLRAYLSDARAGHGSIVLVGGEAGIGKTTLVDNLAREAATQGVLVLTGCCYELTATPPYGPWLAMVNNHPELDDSATSCPALPVALKRDSRVGELDSQLQLFDEFYAFFAAVAARRPLLLVLEDLHWADPASLELLRYVARQLDNLALLLVVTYRADELSRCHPLFDHLPLLVREARAERIDLRALDDDEVRTLIDSRYRLTEAERCRLVAHLRAHAEGNPFFLHEVLRTLEAARILCPAGDKWIIGDLDQAPLPSLARQVIEGRLASLDPETRRLLDVAAIIGHVVPIDLWHSVTAADDHLLRAAITRALDAHILRESPDHMGYQFRHALIREVLYANLILTDRRVLHRCVGETLMKSVRTDPVAIAHHFQQAADPRAAVWQIQAADYAQARFAPQSAIEHFTRALEFSNLLSREEQIRAYRGRGRAYDTAGDYESARKDHEAALGLARDIGDRWSEWQALLDLGLVWASRDYAETGPYWKQALDLARTMDDPAILARSLNWVGNWHVNVEQPLEAWRQHDEALALFQEMSDRRGIAETQDFLGMAAMLSGDLIQSAAHYRRAITLLDDRLRLSSSLANLRGADGQVFLMASVPGLTVPEGRHAAERALQIARDTGWRSGEAFASSHLGVSLTAQGNYGEALAILRQGLDIAEEIAHHQWIALARWSLGVGYLHLFAYSEARACLEQALLVAKDIGSLFLARCASGSLALAYIGQGMLDSADALLAAELDRSADPPTIAQRVQSSAVAELELARDRPDDALRVIDWLIAHSPPRPGGHVPINLMLLRGRALTSLRRLPEAEAALQTARVGAVGQGAVAWLHAIHLALIHLYQAQSRAQDAERELLAAWANAETLAATIPDETLREHYLQHTANQLTFLSSQPAASLSPREVQVLRLVGDGLTDAEIAGRLRISPRTVGQHLRSVYNKLGVSGRAAATRVAVERGIV